MRDSPDLGSSSGSEAGLGGINLNKSGPLPEKWTLPHEWNIEKREVYDNWKMDVQNQITNIAKRLNRSLDEYPGEEEGRLSMKPKALQAPAQVPVGMHREPPMVNKMQLGIRR